MTSLNQSFYAIFAIYIALTAVLDLEYIYLTSALFDFINVIIVNPYLSLVQLFYFVTSQNHLKTNIIADVVHCSKVGFIFGYTTYT